MKLQGATCKEGYMVWIVGQADKYGVGSTTEEAIGDLVTNYPHLFNITGLSLRESFISSYD